MTKTLALTQVAVSLSLVTIRQDDDRLQFSILPILSLTALIMLVWHSQVLIAKTAYHCGELSITILQQLTIYAKVGQIVFNSLSYGFLQL
jgi:lysophospholipid acyltransferase (LPLAT)-like uncharacterized protein